MARRKSKPSRPSSSRLPEAGVKPTGPSSRRGRDRRPGGTGFHLTTRTWIIFYAVVFLVIESVIVFAFVGTGGESRVRRQMLLEAEELREKGKPAEAISVLEEFGERWPGAWATHNFNQRIGEYFFEAGEYKKSADALKSAVTKDPTKWDTRALAGRSLWMNNERQEAATLFREEIEKANRNNDLAHFYLGLWALEQDDPVEAFKQFQAIADPAPWAEEIRVVTDRYREELLEPARKEAEERASELLP